MNNTPLKEAIIASPNISKVVYIANVFPKVQNDLPTKLLGIEQETLYFLIKLNKPGRLLHPLRSQSA
jgi:hypothetical protein